MNCDTDILQKSKAILAGVRTVNTEDFEEDIEELGRLAEAINCSVVEVVVQELQTPNPATYIGSGKLMELGRIAEISDCDYVIFLDTLSPAQLKNITDVLNCTVYDRTGLILEIFKRRAKTKEAKIQVEIANLRYMLPRLTGMRKNLGRQAGASGAMSNKGQGEKQLELDRRHIEKRIARLGAGLKDIEHNRETQRRARSKSSIPSVALVGYTNAGKSTIMNYMLSLGEENTAGTEYDKENITDNPKQVFVKDMLFATLDTSVRHISTGDKKDFLLSDTVGFVSNLPHGLIKAFRSTLAEVKYADVLVIVVDGSDKCASTQIKVTNDTLREVGVGDIPRIVVWNKCDRIEGRSIINSGENERIFASAKTGFGMDRLVEEIKRITYGDNEIIDILIPYDKGAIISVINENAEVLSREYKAEGTHIVADCPRWLAGSIRQQLGNS